MQAGGAARLGNALINLAFPPGCAACSAPCGPGELFCSHCADELSFIEPPYCQICGRPQPATESHKLCPACRKSQSAFDRVRALGLHTGSMARAVRGFKYYGKISAGAGLARLWAESIPIRWLKGADLAAPVPLHPLRMLKRGFNQSLQLGAKLALPEMIPDLLIRKRHTRPQVGLGPAQRRQNVAQAFKVRDKYLERIEGARVMLIDDVFTTGATVNECAAELKYAGAVWVGALTLVRAGKDPEPDESVEMPGEE